MNIEFSDKQPNTFTLGDLPLGTIFSLDDAFFMAISDEDIVCPFQEGAVVDLEQACICFLPLSTQVLPVTAKLVIER